MRASLRHICACRLLLPFLAACGPAQATGVGDGGLDIDPGGGDGGDGGGCAELLMHPDADGDGYGEDAVSLWVCEGAHGYAAEGGDCDDGDPSVGPGMTEVPYDGVDNDCSAGTPDDDLDGDGARGMEDCDDGDASMAPGLTEVCDGVDNDCDGVVDGGCSLIRQVGGQMEEWSIGGDGAVRIVEVEGATGMSGDRPRDLCVTEDDRVAVVSGTGSPWLSLYDRADGTWEHWTTELWDLNNVSYYGNPVCVAGGVVVANTDGHLGALRFDLDSGSVSTSFDSSPYYDLALSAGDVEVVALARFGQIDFLDPVTLDFVDGVVSSLSPEPVALAMGPEDQIYLINSQVVGWWDPSNGAGRTVPHGLKYGAVDVDVDAEGRVLVSDKNGESVLFDGSLEFEVQRWASVSGVSSAAGTFGSLLSDGGESP